MSKFPYKIFPAKVRIKTLNSCHHRSFDDGAVKLQLAADNQSNCWLKAGNQIEKVAPFYCHNIAKTCRRP